MTTRRPPGLADQFEKFRIKYGDRTENLLLEWWWWAFFRGMDDAGWNMAEWFKVNR